MYSRNQLFINGLKLCTRQNVFILNNEYFVWDKIGFVWDKIFLTGQKGTGISLYWREMVCTVIEMDKCYISWITTITSTIAYKVCETSVFFNMIDQRVFVECWEMAFVTFVTFVNGSNVNITDIQRTILWIISTNTWCYFWNDRP